MFSWQVKGKCRKTLDQPGYIGELDDFFPEKHQHAEALRAVAFCLGTDDGIACPILEICRDWGLKNEDHGIWGGLTKEERRHIRRSAQRGGTDDTAQGNQSSTSITRRSRANGNVGSWTSAAAAIRPKIGRPRRTVVLSALDTDSVIGCVTTEETKNRRRFAQRWESVPDDGADGDAYGCSDFAREEDERSAWVERILAGAVHAVGT